MGKMGFIYTKVKEGLDQKDRIKKWRASEKRVTKNLRESETFGNESDGSLLSETYITWKEN